MNEMKEFYFLRHGATGDDDGLPIFKGRVDCPLTAAGESQAIAASTYFSRMRPGAVFTSPLIRAKETARLICETAGLPMPVAASELTDIDCGEWEGRSVSEISSACPESFGRWAGDPGTFTMPGGESVAGVQKRAFSFVSGLLANPEKKILIVTHRMLINVIVLAALGAGLDLYWKFSYGENCGITRLKHDGKRFFLDLMNSPAGA